MDCLANCQRTDREGFRPKPNSRNLAYEYQFDPEQEFKGAANYFYLLGVEEEDGKRSKVTFVKEESNLDNGLIVLQAKHEPPHTVSLIPDEYVNAGVIEKAIDQVVTEFESGSLSKCAIIDFCRENSQE